MRGMAIFIWALLIFILTCTSDFHRFIELGVIHFEWDSNPRLSELLLPLPVHLSSGFFIQKIGHVTAFFILTSLLLIKFRLRIRALLWSLSYAALTEILQLYFTRDGRIFDIGFDTLGILLATALVSLYKVHSTKQIQFIDKD